MNYLSGAFRYVAGSDADRHDEVRRLIERIKNASLAQDRRNAITQLAQLAQEGSRRQAEIGEIGLKVFYAVLDQDKQYQANLRAVLQLLIAICSEAQPSAAPDGNHSESIEASARQQREARNIVATNVDMFLGLPDAISLVLDQLSHDDFNIRSSALELLTAMAAYSRQTLQAAILDASQGVSRICDLLDDSQQIIRFNTVILLSMICTESPEVSKIVSFSGVPEKLFDLVLTVNPKASSLANIEVTDVLDASLEAAVIIQDVLELLGTLIDSSPTTRTAVLEMSHVTRIVDILGQIMRDSGVTSENMAVELGFNSGQIALLKQNTRNISVSLRNITRLLQGDQTDVEKMANELSNTDVFNHVQLLSFLEYIDSESIQSSVNLELSSIRMEALRTLAALVNAHTNFRLAFCSSLCPSPMLDAATPQICTLHTMLHDRSAALRVAAFVALRDSFVLDSGSPAPSSALVNALTGSSSLLSLVQGTGVDQELDDEDEPEINIPSKYLAILGEALKDALTLYPEQSDEAGVFYSSLLLAWTMFRVPGARERLLASYAHNAGNSLFPQIMRVLSHSQRQQAPAAVRIGLLSLVCSWLHGSTSAVSMFLSSAMHLPMVVEIFDKGTNSNDSCNVHIKGLAAVILGICYEATDSKNAMSGESGFITGGRGPQMVIPRGTISDVIRNHIGVADFTARLEDIKGTPQFTQALSSVGLWHLSSRIAKVELEGAFLGEKELGHEYWYDPDLVAVIDNIYTLVGAKAVDLLPVRNSNRPAMGAPVSNGELQNYPNMNLPNPGPSRTMEMLIADSAKDEVLNSYKEYIKGQDKNLTMAQSNIEKLEKALKEAELKISSMETPINDNDAYHPSKGANGHNSQIDSDPRSMPKMNDTRYLNGVSTADDDYHMHANGVENEDDHNVDAAHRARELAAVVMHLEEELQEQRERSQVLMDDLDNSRRSQEDWRRKSEEIAESNEKQRADKDQVLAQVEQLNQEVSVLKSEALVKAEELSSANLRLSELEDRCAELTDMRKRTEQEFTSIKEEVALRAEQNIELSGKLYEADERVAALEEEREQLVSKLLSAESSQRSAADAALSDHSSIEKLNVVEEKLKLSHQLNQEQKSTIEELQHKAQELEESKVELSNKLDSVRVRYEELSINHSSLTDSFDKLNRESVTREAYEVLQQDFYEQSSKMSAAEIEGEKLKKAVLELELAAAQAVESSTPKRPRSNSGTQTQERAEENARLLNEKVEVLQSALSEAASIAKTSSDELTLAETSLRELHADRRALQLRVDKLENEVSSLESELEAAKQSREKAEREALEHQRQLEESASVVSTAREQEVGLLNSKLVQVEEMCAELEKKKDDLASEVETLKISEAALIEKNKESIVALEERYVHDTKTVQEDFNSLQKDLSSLLEEERKKNKNLYESLQSKTEHLGETSANLCCCAAALESTETALQDAIEKYNVLHQVLEAEKKTVKQMQDALTAQSNDRSSERTSTRSVENKIMTLESELTVARQKQQRQKDTYESKLRNLVEDLKHANETIDATKRMYLASEQSANASSAKAIAILAAVRSELSSVKAEVDYKTKLVTELEESKQSMEDQHEANIQGLNLKLDEAAKNLDVLALHKEKAERAVAELSATVESLTKDRDSYSVQNEKLSNKLHECETVVADLETKISGILQEKQTTAKKMEEETRLLFEKTSECQRIADELASEKEAHNSLHCEFKEILTEKEKLFETKVAVEEELETVKASLVSSEEKRQFAEQDAEDIREWGSGLQVKAQRMETAVTQFKEVEKNLEDSNEALNQAQAWNAALSKELQNLKKDMAAAVARSQSITREKGEAEEELALHKSRVAELETRLREIRDQHIEKLRVLEDSMRASASRCANLESSLATAERQLAENANLSDEVHSAKSQVAKANRLTQSMRLRAESAEKHVEEMRLDSEAMSRELSELRDKSNNSALKALESEHNELLVCLAELEMECASLKQELGRD